MPTRDQLPALSRIISYRLLLAFAWPVFAVAADEPELITIPAITDDYILDDFRPAAALKGGSIDLVLARGEYEPASFVLLARESVRGLVIAATGLRSADGRILKDASVDIRVVKRWLQRWNGSRADSRDPRIAHMTPELLLYDDRLIRVEQGRNKLRLKNGEYVDISGPGMKSGFETPGIEAFPVQDASTLQPVDIDAGSNRQFWITVHVPDDADPGIYRGEVAAWLGDRKIAAVPIQIEVLPFALADSRVHNSIYYRGKLSPEHSEGSISSEYKSSEQMLADLKNLRAHGVNNPVVYQKYSSGLLVDVLKLRQLADMSEPRLYYLGVNVVNNADGKVSPGLASEVKAVLEEAAPFGIDDVYFYARDEARGEELEYQYPFWESVKQAGGKIMAAGWQTDGNRSGNFDITGGREDLFVSLGMPRVEEAARWHGKGRKIYSYQNPTGGRELPETWRRNYGLLLWQNDYDGGMPYAWQHSYADGWNDFDHAVHKDHNFTYPALGGPIDTTQWEGLREGIDDLRYLSTLLNLLDARGKAFPAEAASARGWLDELKALPLGSSDLDAVRAELVGHILALSDFAPVESTAPGAVSQLRVGAVQPDGSAEVSWWTGERQPSRLSLRQGDSVRQFSSTALMRNHRVRLTDLRPERQYEVTVEVGEPGIPAYDSESLVFSTDSHLALSGQIAAVGSVAEFVGTARSAYRVSLGVDRGDDLLGWWRFSDAKDPGVDLSSRRRDAALKGDAMIAAGWFGRGVELDGKGAFVNMPGIAVPENGTATVEGWFLFRSFAMDNRSNMGLFSGLYQHAGNNNFYFARTNEYFDVGSLLRKDTWHHIALSWSGDTRTAALYVDGRPAPLIIQGKIEEVPEIDGLTIGRHVSYLGGLIEGASNTLAGSVDEIRVWRRVLSAAEVRLAYDAGAGDFNLVLPASASDQSAVIIGATAADAAATTTVAD